MPAAKAEKSYKVVIAHTDPKGKAWKVGDTYPAPQPTTPEAQQALQAAIAAGQVQEQPPEE